MPYTVLVIDDQWSMQEYTRFVLQAAGHRVLLAPDPVIGLSLTRTEHPDVIIMDARLYSAEMLLAFCQPTLGVTIPVILITLNTQDAESLPQAVTGVFGALQKPFLPPQLLTMVDGLVGSTHMLMAV